MQTNTRRNGTRARKKTTYSIQFNVMRILLSFQFCLSFWDFFFRSYDQSLHTYIFICFSIHSAVKKAYIFRHTNRHRQNQLYEHKILILYIKFQNTNRIMLSAKSKPQMNRIKKKTKTKIIAKTEKQYPRSANLSGYMVPIKSCLIKASGRKD